MRGGMGTRVVAVRRKLAMPFRLLKGRDLALHAAAVTFYSGIAVVPVALLAIWITGLIAGVDRVRRLTGQPPLTSEPTRPRLP